MGKTLSMNVLNIIPYFLIWLFAIGFSMNTLHSEVYEGWLDPDSTGPITPIWMEIHETVAGVYSGWYVNRIDLDTIPFKGETYKNGIVLKVMSGRTAVKEQFTLQKTEHGMSGFWKPAKGYGADIHIFPTDSLYAKTMQLNIDPAMLRKGKGLKDSVSDIQYLMVRKGIASIKVYRERIDNHRPWISFHVIDLLKNKEIQLTDYLIDHAFAKTKIAADAYAEEEALNQIKQYGEDELVTMTDCGMNLDEELHLDNIVLYPNRSAITFDYLNIFGMHEQCEYLMYPVRYTLPIEEFKSCIRPGTFLSRLLN
ncbi:MAG: hypothetical protein EBU66_01210 [Bacteroidetes bacterium]|nr:hypothetical protein [bacterium]NBP63293.1 hypothetical protein [Bacteroidota bacterium]